MSNERSQEGGEKLSQPEIIRNDYEIIDENGQTIPAPEGLIDALELRRSELQSEILQAFPERDISEKVSPQDLRKRFQKNGFVTPPVAVIPPTKQALEQLQEIMRKYPDIVEEEDVDVVAATQETSFNDIAMYMPNADLVLYTDPQDRLESYGPEDFEFYQEYARLILAHELGHSAVRQPMRVVIKIDSSEGIIDLRVLEVGLGTSTPSELYDKEDDMLDGNIMKEGFATLLASQVYHLSPYGDDVNIIDGFVAFRVPERLWSKVPDEDEAVADGHSLSASILLEYEKAHPGLIDLMTSFAKGDFDRDSLIKGMDNIVPGLYEKLDQALYESHHVKIANELGIIVEDED